MHCWPKHALVQLNTGITGLGIHSGTHTGSGNLLSTAPMQHVSFGRQEHHGLSPDAQPSRGRHTEAVVDAELSVPNRQQQHGLNGPASSWSCSQPEALIADKELYRLQMQSAGYNSGNSSWPEDALEHPLRSFRGHVGTQWVCGNCFLSRGFKHNGGSPSNCQCCGRAEKRKQQQVQASVTSTSSNDGKGRVLSAASSQHRQAQAVTPECAGMLAGSKPRLQEVPEQVLAGKGGEGTRSTGSRETQLNQAPVEAATTFVDEGSSARVHEAMAQALSAHRPRVLADLLSSAGPEQTRPATTELQPIGRLREAWLATESALGPEHTVTQAVKQHYEQLVQCRQESMPLHKQLKEARKQWEQSKQTL